MEKNNNKKPSPWKSISIGAIVLLVLVIYAYGFQITKVNLEELRRDTRQASLQRVIRALAKPEIFEYDQTEQIINYPVYIPCHADGTKPSIPDHASSDPYLVLTPGCASPGETIQVEGFNFAPNVTGPVRFVPGSDLTNIVTLGREVAETDQNGYFVLSMKLPERPSDDVQYIRATLRRNIGSPHFTQTAKDTWEKIIETVFLALLATTFGTFLAIPLSFLAARNLMVPVRSPLTSISLSLIGWPVGMYAGFVLVRWVGNFNASLDLNVWLGLITILVVILAVWLGMRWALPQEEITHAGKFTKAIRLVVILASILVSFFGFFQLARLAMSVGQGLIPGLGSFGFMGNFMYQMGDIILVITSVLGSLAAGGAVSSLLSRFGQQVAEKLPAAGVKVFNLILTPISIALILILIGQLIEWLYELGRPFYTLWGPLITGVVIGLALAIFSKAKDALPTGMVIYYITRTFLNGLRSIEALVMAIVFVIAVGIGPFAGVMALGLHTIVSLAKLYSEQVESIMTGPLEAVQATGANRLQTIIYAVVPQIVPPYISYTMYRWDINVRMSTIIGFVGGGGIGFLLQQNINLLNYSAASTQMLAIAFVVASMDYISSVLRERTI
ncbi:MAG: ABC transporter permease subunit [Chloroflexota bacterium]